MSLFKRLICSTSILLISTLSIASEDRPPQFVLMAFDNCMENATWQQVTDYLDDMNSVQDDKLKFTFFLSATGLVARNNRGFYKSPKGTGKSNIGWAYNKNNVLKRINYINKLYKKGNEIASHAVGHFRGKDWSESQWNKEFLAYNYIIDNTQSINGFTGKTGKLAFSSNDLSGFRAPYLQANKNTYKVIDKFNMRYDTSDADFHYSTFSKWPAKIKVNGKPSIWNFGLGRIPLHSKPGKKTLSMDYNFYVTHSKAKPDTKPKAKVHGDNMLQSYLNYFLVNYNSNRSPVHIGHHFSPYQHGEYNRALFQFASKVCGLPEVRCATYSEYADYLDSLSAKQISTYNKNKFPHLSPLKLKDLKGTTKPKEGGNNNTQASNFIKSCKKRAASDWWGEMSEYSKENYSRFYNKVSEELRSEPLISAFNSKSLELLKDLSNNLKASTLSSKERKAFCNKASVILN